MGLRASCGSNRLVRVFARWRLKQPLKPRIPLNEMLINLFRLLNPPVLYHCVLGVAAKLLRCWSKVGRARNRWFPYAWTALLCNFAVLHDKPWLSPLGLAAAYEEVAASLRGKGHAQATGLNCFEKVHQLRLAWQTGNYNPIDAESSSDAAAQNDKCRQLLAQLQAEQPAAGILSVAEVRPRDRTICSSLYFIYMTASLSFLRTTNLRLQRRPHPVTAARTPFP